MYYDENDLYSLIAPIPFERLPEPVIMILRKMLDDINDGSSSGKAPTDISRDNDWGSNVADNVNIIPSKYHDSCCHVLIGICYDGDNLDRRIHEFLDHASLVCHGINKELFFLTTQWNSFVANQYKGYIESLRRDGVNITMIYITNKGIALMPV